MYTVVPQFQPAVLLSFLIHCETALDKYFYPACYPVNDAGKLTDIFNLREGA